MPTDQERMRKLEDTVSTLQRLTARQAADLETIGKAIRDASRPRGADGEEMIAGAEVWACEVCSSRLGVYDPRTEEMCLKYRDSYVYVSGGRIRVPCRNCAHMNIIEPAGDAPDPLVGTAPSTGLAAGAARAL